MKIELFRRVIIGILPEFNNIVNSIDTTNKSSINKAVQQFSNEIQIATEPLFAKTYKFVMIVNHKRWSRVNGLTKIVT